MCGIIAHLSFNTHDQIKEQHLSQLNDMLIHRGPDDGGVFIDGNIALAMRRLSIVDIGGGHQPITTRDGRFTIVFNGEIYNHADLRRELLAAGCLFQSKSDTEVLLYAYAYWGKDCLVKLNGMFAFAIWDHHNKELFVARDRMGVKPLYYAIDGRRAMFASELTPIARSGFFDLQWNHKAIADYLSYWYVCEPATMFKGIHQLPPAHYAIVKNGAMHIKRYWQIPAEQERPIAFSKAVVELDDLLKDAVRLRLNADVPFGTFLSGGIDSGIITSMASHQIAERLKSFAIGFKSISYDETPLAKLTAAQHGVDLNVHIMEDISPSLVQEITSAFDEPLGNASYVPTYLLARAARRTMKVVLTGDGGDELFGGYPTYQAEYYRNLWQGLPSGIKAGIKGMINRLPVSHGRISLDYQLKQLMQGIDLDYARAHLTWRAIINRSMQEQLWRPQLWQALNHYDSFDAVSGYFAEAKNLSVGNQLMYADLNTYLLNDHLRKVDRMTMAHGLEARAPFMDYRIVEFAMRLPKEHKYNFLKTKRILKAVGRNYLPQAVLAGKKKGLTSPIAGWISNELKEYMKEVLKGGIIEEMFEPARVQALLDEHLEKRKDNSRPLWALLALQIWSKNILKK